MDERASFEARAVLEPRRARLARLALLVPAVALVAIAWAGLSGPRSNEATADLTDPTAAAVAPEVRRPQPPAQVLGLSVHRLDDIQPRGLGRDDVIAISGWYVAKAITDCPPLAAIYRDGALPELRPDIDELAFCERSGVLYAAQPGLDGRPLANDVEDNRARAGVSAVTTTLVIGVVAPMELEMVGAESTEVVVLGRFVETGDGCSKPVGCRRELIVDHVAWTPDA